MSGLEIHKREPENAMIEIAMHVVAVVRTQGSTLVADPEWQSTDAVIRVERLIDDLAPDGHAYAERVVETMRQDPYKLDRVEDQ
jgi:hypothetical protein